MLLNRSTQVALSFALLASMGFPAVAIASDLPAPFTIAQNQSVQKRRIAVLDFDSSNVSSSWISSWQGGAARAVGDILVNKLVEGGSYRVIERSRLQEIMREQNLGDSGRVDASTAAKIGKLLGVEAVLVGNITQFNIEQASSGMNIFGLFGNAKQTNTAVVELTARLIDTGTGEIIATAQGQGKADQDSGGTSVLGVSTSNGAVNNDSLLKMAADKAVTQLVTTVNGSADKVVSNGSGIEAVVADITGGQVTLNKGSSAGFATGMKISVERVTKQVKDPATGQVIRSVSSSIGKLEIIEVARDYAVGKVLSGSGFKVGDAVKSVKD